MPPPSPSHTLSRWWQGVVFCTFNRLGRITPRIFQAWIEILHQVPKSVIWLYKHPNTAVRERH